MMISHPVVGKRLLVWCLTALALIATSTVGAGTVVYKLTDRLGNVTYTDVAPKKPDPAVVVKTLLIVHPDFGTDHASAAPSLAYPPIEQADASTRDYHKIAIVSPGNDETLRANNGNIVLRADVDPPLRPGHALRFYLGSEPVGTVTSVELAVANVDRGSYSLRVDVLDENSDVLKSSSSSIFHLQRTSALAPTRKPKSSPPALKR
jgi:hypothetical protein